MTAATRAMVLLCLIAVGLALAAPDSRPVLAHEKTKLVAVRGTGRCPSSVQNCTETWTHVNFWTHYTVIAPRRCTLATINRCGITITSTPGRSSCRSSSNCGHGPHSSTSRPTGPGTWTTWNGHSNIKLPVGRTAAETRRS